MSAHVPITKTQPGSVRLIDALHEIRRLSILMKDHMSGVFDIATVNVLREVVESAWSELSPARKSAHTRSELAETVLKCAALGERSPARLKDAALRDLRLSHSE